MFETFLFLGTATVVDVFWVKVVNPWLDKKPIKEVFVRPKGPYFPLNKGEQRCVR